jgi:hypothetical protein
MSHLEGCLDCQDFLHSLGTFAPILRNQLDEALRDYPGPVFEAALRGNTRIERERAGLIAAAFKRIVNWLFAPAGKPALAYRWVAVSAIVAALVLPIGLRIYLVSRTQRAIERQMDRVVELIFEEPLVPGIESALLRTQPSISDYVDDLERSVDIWLEETASQYFLN